MIDDEAPPADESEAYYVVDNAAHSIRRISYPSGCINDLPVSLHSSEFPEPRGLVMDSNGDIFVSDHNLQQIKKIDLVKKTMTAYAGRGRDPDPSSSLPSVGSSASTSSKAVAPPGKKEPNSQQHFRDDCVGAEATLWDMSYMTIDAEDSLYVADSNRLRKIERSDRHRLKDMIYGDDSKNGGLGRVLMKDLIAIILSYCANGTNPDAAFACILLFSEPPTVVDACRSMGVDDRYQ